MKKRAFKTIALFLLVLVGGFISCKNKSTAPSKEAIGELNLLRGEPISCGPANKQFGSVGFEITCGQKVKDDFNTAMAMMHSFEYEEAEKMFAKIIDEEPACVMAYWGIAMSNYHPLWSPPTEPELRKGAKAIEIARSLPQKNKRESDLIEAIASFYQDWEKLDHAKRAANYAKSMEELYQQNPDDTETAILYALALVASADRTDKTFKNQKKAGEILNALYPNKPNHPGIAHYIIHTYDHPELAGLALPTARIYASIAPSSAHALHMPSHTFTMLGLWGESVKSNHASVASARCYAEAAGIEGHWDEELHGLDYLVYAYLQKGDNEQARKQLDYVQSMSHISPVNFKVAYALAAIPSRYLLENKKWNDAANLQLPELAIDWKKFPWQNAIHHFTRLMGFVQTSNLVSAKKELAQLNLAYDSMKAQKDFYKAEQILIQIKTGEAWIAYAAGNKAKALEQMHAAADLEDRTEKHPVTPGPVIPARELLGDLYLLMNEPAKALVAYETNLKNHVNRFNGVYGAGLAAERAGDSEKASHYYRLLISIAGDANQQRPELNKAKLFLDKKELEKKV